MKKLFISLKFSKLVVTKPLTAIITPIHNFIVKFVQILEIYKKIAGNRVDKNGNRPQWGYYASQGLYYYGYKLHAICGISGVIHSYDMTAANVHDLQYLNDAQWEYPTA